jgi:hypothetical protein
MLMEDKILAVREQDQDYYQPEDPYYWQAFRRNIPGGDALEWCIRNWTCTLYFQFSSFSEELVGGCNWE